MYRPVLVFPGEHLFRACLLLFRAGGLLGKFRHQQFLPARYRFSGTTGCGECPRLFYGLYRQCAVATVEPGHGDEAGHIWN